MTYERDDERFRPWQQNSEFQAAGYPSTDSRAYGYDAQEGQYGDLVSKGVIDPTKVVRAALQGAASIAGLLMTTEAMVAEKPKKVAPPVTPPPMDY